MRPELSAASVWLLFWFAAAPLRGAESPGWYTVELKTGASLTAKLLSQEKDSCVFSFQGTMMRLDRNDVRRLERVTSPSRPVEAPAPSTAHSSTVAPVGKGTEIEAPQPGQTAENEERLEAILDSIERLASTEDDGARHAYVHLQKEFVLARPLLHVALRHQSPRVRSLVVKLLGEKGTAAEDLPAVSTLLSDERAAVRLSAVMAVRAFGPDGFADLMRYVETETVPNNRKIAVKTFYRWKEKRALVPLAMRLKSENDDGVRNFIVDTLEGISGLKLGRDPATWTAYLTQQEHAEALERIMRISAPRPANEGALESGEARE